MAALLAICSLLMMGFLVVPREGGGASLAVGDPAPAFDLVSLTGDRVRLADLAGKPVVLNFWATWCGPCLDEMPDFQSVYQQYRTQGLQFYAINLGESPVAVEHFLRRIGVDLPVLLDLNDEAQEAYRILPIPSTFFIDSTGTIQAIYQHRMTRVQIEAEVVRLLEAEQASEGVSVWSLPTF